MSRMAYCGAGLRVDPRGEVDKSEQIQLAVEFDQSDEARRTRIWRLDQFVDLGFDLARAALMADDSRIDLGQARRLVASGCPLETASRILL
jgi:urease accessory protein UreE